MASILAGVALAASSVAAAGAPQGGKLNPDHSVPPAFDARTGPMHDAMLRGLEAGTLRTLPAWSRGFKIAGVEYSYTLLGTDPALGPATTTIPTVLVPIRLTVSDYPVNGKPLVLDATPQMADIKNSPIFTPAKFDTGQLQFADAMLHAEFPRAPKNWHLIFSPTVAPTVDVVAPAGAVKVQQSKSGNYLGIIKDGPLLNAVFNQVVRAQSPDKYVVFVTYNSLYVNEFGFHTSTTNKAGTRTVVWAYNSWLKGVNDLFTLPSPDADTFAHEIAETVHDALGLSLTLEWGNPFGRNKCFQPYIEVGDAVEFAPAKVQNYKEKVTINGKETVYTLQTEAMLPWFERQSPSSAIHGAYSFPGETALGTPAPLDCK
jgi:hypothetical protein